MDGAAAPNAGSGGSGGVPQGAPAAAPSTLDQYELVSVIGRGSFGTVSKIRRRADGRLLVWKELNYGLMREKEKQLVVSEVNILRELRHPYIVRYYDRVIDKAATKIYIVMEYCEGGDLGALVKKAKKEGTLVEEELVWRVFAQIVVALRECHRHKDASGAAKPILHRDLKPGNIFLDGSGNIKIGDFGLAKELPSESALAYTNVGTPFYMSPEMINECRYNEKSDIWALGCLLYELCALAPPFDATNHLSLAVKINAGKFARIPAKFSEDLYRAIRWMLTLDQAKRPSIEELERISQVRATIQALSGAPAPAAAPAGAAAAAGGAGAASAAALNARAAALRAKEEELARREEAVARREEAVARREAAVSAAMARLPPGYMAGLEGTAGMAAGGARLPPSDMVDCEEGGAGGAAGGPSGVLASAGAAAVVGAGGAPAPLMRVPSFTGNVGLGAPPPTLGAKGVVGMGGGMAMPGAVAAPLGLGAGRIPSGGM